MPRRLTVLCYLDLIQDLDVLLPVILAARDDARLNVRVIVARWLAAGAPRVGRILKSHDIRFCYVPRRNVVAGRGPSLWGVGAVLTASESDQPTHTAGYALTIRARNRDIPTFTLQHGLDSLGGGARFASAHVFSWFAPDHVPEGLTQETLGKLLPVGRPMIERQNDAVEFDVGVFENLHAEVYSEIERERFVSSLDTVLDLRHNNSFLIRPHPAGRWLDSVRPRLHRHRNATLVPPSGSLADLTPGYHEVGQARRVISTPSTIALDAAMAGRPGALALPGSGPYASLPVLADVPAWLDFVDGRLDTSFGRDGLRLLDSIMTQGDPVARIIDHIANAPASVKAPGPNFR